MRVLPFVLLVGCVTAQNFGATWAAIRCGHAEECGQDWLDDYESVEACEEEFSLYFGGPCEQKHCAYNAEKANACVADLRAWDCDLTTSNAAPDCALVFTDCVSPDFGICVALGE